jgi:hypothetical protein
MKRKGESKNSGSTSDPARDYMKSRGASSHVVEGGLPAAVARWESIAESVDGYDLTLDDWLNDMDLRDIIAGALAAAGKSEGKLVSGQLKQADDRFREATVATGPVWGNAVAASHSHHPEGTWWYFRIPRHPGATLRTDLESAGLT